MGSSGFNRRKFLALAGASAAMSAVPAAAASGHAPADGFTFLFLTDTHTEPELNGVAGTELAMRRARTIPADFAIHGGDHVIDALAVNRERATQLFDLYARTEQNLGLKVHHTLGNHDIFGTAAGSGVSPADPGYGKALFVERFGPTYYSFDHKGCHFVVLDSVGITPAGGWEGRIDREQLDWLAADLAALSARAPVVVATHIPLVTAVPSYAAPNPAFPDKPFVNGPATIKLLERHNVLGVLQGHTHVNETVLWRGIPYSTSGAVCGNWWHGPRMGTPEGFTVVRVAGGTLTTRYVPTGFQSVAPEAS